MNLKEIIIDGFYVTEEEKEFFSMLREVLNLKKLIYRVPMILFLFYAYCQAINLVDYLRQLQG